MENNKASNSYPAQSRTGNHPKSVFVLTVIMLLAIVAFSPLRDVILSEIRASASEPVDYFMGDIDYNGKVEPSDARTILRAAVALETLTGMGGNRVEMISDDVPYQAELADIDGDKLITPADARAVLRMSVQVDPLILFEREIENEPTSDDPDVTEPTTEPTSDRPSNATFPFPAASIPVSTGTVSLPQLS